MQPKGGADTTVPHAHGGPPGQAGPLPWYLGNSSRRCIELGCLFTAVGSDSGVLTRGSEQLAQKFKGQG